MTNSERRSTSVPRETNRQDQIPPDHVTVASVSLSALLKAKISSRNSKTSMDEIVIGTYSCKLGTGTPTLVPGSTTFAQYCTRYHPFGTMVPLPCHPPLAKDIFWFHACILVSCLSESVFVRNSREGVRKLFVRSCFPKLLCSKVFFHF